LLSQVDSIQIVKKWRGAANEGEKGIIAVRTSSAMARCEWKHKKGDTVYE
jgi:hypothetical protein